MARKVYDNTTGEHVAKPSSLPSVDEIYERLAEAFAIACPRCNAKPGEPCQTIVGTRGERVYPHPARMDAARSER